MSKMTLGVILGNRDFFPDPLVSEAREQILRVFAERGIDAVLLDAQDTKMGAVETWRDAQKCGSLFFNNRQRIDGVLVCLPNFGDEKGVADSIRLSELQVPVLVQASPDELDQFGLERRRDAYCGKISVCNNLRQYGIPFSLTEKHVVALDSEDFSKRFGEFSPGMPGGKRRPPCAYRRRRSEAQRLQHDALQRKAAGSHRDQREHD